MLVGVEGVGSIHRRPGREHFSAAVAVFDLAALSEENNRRGAGVLVSYSSLLSHWCSLIASIESL
jgi:hypothetical protein